MGQVLHGSAKTTHAIRGELQRSQASVASLAKRFGINEKTVLKWRKRQSVEDMPMGPRERRSTVLSPMEEAAIVALRVQTMGLAGIRRGKTTITTVSNPKAPCPLDKVNREFRVSRPNALWVVDFTYVHTWTGFVYVAFVIDAFARRIVGWKVSTSATAGFVHDALEQAIHARRPAPEDGLIHHSDRGVQYLAMSYTQRLAEAELVPSVGSVGDSVACPGEGRGQRLG